MINSGKKNEQNILLKISQSIIGTLDYEKVLQIISDGMSELLEIETAAIFLLQNENEIYQGAATPPLDPGMPEELRRAKLENHPHIYKTLTSKKPQAIQDTRHAKLTESEKLVVKLRKLRSLLYLPFIQKNQVLGVLILGTSNKSRLFSPADINLGQTVANQLAIGIQNARLYHNLELKNKELEAEIAARKKVEEALRHSEAHLSNALRIASLGHWEYDFNEDYFVFSDEFLSLYRTNAQKIGGYKMSSREYSERFLPPEDQHLIAEEMKKGAHTFKDEFSAEAEHRIIYADGNEGYILVRYRLVKDADGKNIKLFGVNQDITERKLSEKALVEAKKHAEESELKYRSLFDQAAEGIILMDDKGKIVQANNSFAQMHGYTLPEIYKKNIIDLDVRGQATFPTREHIHQRLLRNEVLQIETIHYHKKGHQFPINAIVQSVHFGDQEYFLCFHQDLTQQKKIERELKEHQENLEKLVKEKTRDLDHAIEELTCTNDELSNKNAIINQQNEELKQTLRNLKEAQARLIRSEKMASLGILTAGVAHEINNPLNYIMGSYVALESYFQRADCPEHELIGKLLNRLKIGLDKATEIVQGLNQFSRENKSHDEDCNIHNIIENCLSMLGNQTKNRIEVNRQYTTKPLVIKGNVGQLHQVFLNILTNAVQAIKENGILRVATSVAEHKIRIAIEDNGEGIAAENIPKITDPFFTTKDPGKGTGLGLSISYTILQEHQGNLEFESSPGQGTLVKVTLPYN